MSGKNRNLMLDFLKGIGCIGVVFIHVRFPGNLGEIVSYLARFAVPMFFMISGYYAFENKQEVLLKKIKKIGWIIIYSLLLYIFYTVFVRKSDGLELLTYPSYWLKMIILGNFDVFGAYHLWFLVALVYAYLILYIILKKNWYPLAIRGIPFLFLLRIIMCAIVETKNVTWYAESNFLVCALPYLFLGNYVAYREKEINKFNNISLLIIAMLGAIFGIINVLCEWKINLAEVGVTFYAIAIFVLAIKNSNISLCDKVEKLGQKYSLYVYVIHLVIADVVGKLANIVRADKINNGYGFPIVVLGITIFVSYVIHNFVLRNIDRVKK